MFIMNVTKCIKTMMINHDIKHIDVANKIGYTKQGFSNLLKKNNYKLNDIIAIADIIGYDVELHFTDRNSNDNIILKSNDD